MKRTVAPTDVFSALTELEFDSFRARLEQELEAYTEIKAGKRKAKKSDASGDAPAGEPAKGDDGDVEMTDNPAKKMKREDEGEVAAGGDGDGDGDETQEEVEEEEGDEEEGEDEEEEHEEKRVEDDIDRVEDLDGGTRPMDPDADETDDDDDGPGSQLHNDLGLG